jgi:hypothetical protein
MTILPPTCSFSRMFLLLPPVASGRMATVAAEASGEQAVSEAAMSGCGADEGGGGCSMQTRHRKAGGMAQAGGCRERERHTRRGHLQLGRQRRIRTFWSAGEMEAKCGMFQRGKHI